jgi:hypothetical protein
MVEKWPLCFAHMFSSTCIKLSQNPIPQNSISATAEPIKLIKSRTERNSRLCGSALYYFKGFLGICSTFSIKKSSRQVGLSFETERQNQLAGTWQTFLCVRVSWGVYCLLVWFLLLGTRGFQRDVVYVGWPIASSYMSPNAGGGSCGVSANEYNSTVHRSPNKLWRSNSIFNLFNLC